MDCKLAQRLLAFGRPLTRELDDPDAEALQEHLADCPECGPTAQAERMADHAIGRAVQTVPLPIGLRERLLVDVRTRARAQVRRRRWRMGLAVTAAACLLMALGLFLGWPGRSLPLDPNDIVKDMPFPGIHTLSRHQAQDYFREKGFVVTAPMDFDYQTLQFYGLAPLASREVPLLLFTRGAYQARVYILREGRFDLEEARTAAGGAASGYRIEIRHHPTDARLVYLVIYNSDSLQPFLTDHPQDGDT